MNSAVSEQTEIETKLDIPDELSWAEIPDPTEDPAVRASGAVQLRRAAPVTLNAVYHDTDALDLLRSKVTLRRRTGGKDAGWHLKLPADPPTPEIGAPAAPITARREFQVPVGDPEATTTPSSSRAARSIPPQLLSMVIGTARGRWIAPIARLHTERTLTVVCDETDTPLVEIADDRVEAQRLGADQQVSWREVEVELLEGTTAQLAAVVAFLVARGAVVSSRQSKIGTVIDLGEFAERATVPGRLVQDRRDALVHADRALRIDPATPGAVDVVRSARSVLDLLGLADRPSTAALARWEELVSAEREILASRSLLVTELTDTHVRYADKARSAVESELSRRESVAVEALELQLRTEEHLRLLQDWDDLVPAADAAALPVDQLEERLDGIWADLRDAVDAALGDPDFGPAVQDAHRVAVRARDCLISLLPEFLPDAVIDAEDAIIALDTVIAALSAHRDAGLAAAVLEQLVGNPSIDGATGFVLGRLFAVMTSAQSAALEDFSDVWDELGEAELPISVQR